MKTLERHLRARAWVRGEVKRNSCAVPAASSRVFSRAFRSTTSLSRKLRLGFFQDGDVGVGVSEGEEILVGSFRFGGVTRYRIRTGESWLLWATLNY